MDPHLSLRKEVGVVATKWLFYHRLNKEDVMTNIRVDLDSVQVIEGQGVGEGDFELRVQATEGNNVVIWPSLNGSTR